jgi:hypothetical protein
MWNWQWKMPAFWGTDVGFVLSVGKVSQRGDWKF